MGDWINAVFQPSVAFAVLSSALYFTFVVNPINFYKKRKRYLMLAATAGKRPDKKNSSVNIGGNLDF